MYPVLFSWLGFVACCVLLNSNRLFLLVSGLSSPSPSLTTTTITTSGSPPRRVENHPFFQQVQEWLEQVDIPFEQVSPTLPFGNGPRLPSRLLALSTTTTVADVASCKNNTTSAIALHLIPTPSCRQDCLPPQLLKTWTNRLSKCGDNSRSTSNTAPSAHFSKIIHLHQDVWMVKTNICQCRLLAATGRVSRRVFARQTIARRIHAPTALDFLRYHHLWGATRAKYYYGLFVKNKHKLQATNDDDDDDGELVAVATFSNRRKVLRRGVPYRSHELLRLCTQRNMTVVGGISKLLKAFERDQQPNDIVTVVDRNWGHGDGWHAVGFTTVGIMDPIVMAVARGCPTLSSAAGMMMNTTLLPPQYGRRHLVGAGIRRPEEEEATTNETERLGLPLHILNQLNATNSAETAYEILAHHHYFPVHDAGVERLYKVVAAPPDSTIQCDPLELWQNSKPSYPTSYYSDNTGIAALLRHAADCCGKDDCS